MRERAFSDFTTPTTTTEHREEACLRFTQSTMDTTNTNKFMKPRLLGLDEDCGSSSDTELSEKERGRLTTRRAHEHIFLTSTNRVSLDVGGKAFHTTWATLTRNTRSMFSSMFSGRFPIETQADGTVFIDRDPTHFQLILNYLRDGEVPLDGLNVNTKRALMKESHYYQIQGLHKILLQDLKKEKQRVRNELSHEKEYKLKECKEQEVARLIKDMTMLEGYEFESWLGSQDTTVNLLFSKKITKGELMLLDRLQGYVGQR